MNWISLDDIMLTYKFWYISYKLLKNKILRRKILFIFKIDIIKNDFNKCIKDFYIVCKKCLYWIVYKIIKGNLRCKRLMDWKI